VAASIKVVAIATVVIIAIGTEYCYWLIADLLIENSIR